MAKYTLIPTLVVAVFVAACSGTNQSQQSATAAPEGAAPATAPTGDSAAPAAPGTGTNTAASPAPAAPAPASASASAPAPAAAAAPAAPAPPPAPTFREVTLPVGTPLSVTLVTPLASNTSKVEDTVSGTLVQPLVVSGTTAIPRGALLSGTVLETKESGRVKGKASIALQFNRLNLRGESIRIQASRVAVEAQQNKKDDVKKGGIGAGAGAVIGAIAGGGKGAAIGATVGAAGGVLATKGGEVKMPAGSIVNMTLTAPLKILVPEE